MATREASASIPSSSRRRGPFTLLRDAIDDVVSRRRLVGYLVQADAKKKGADSLLGNIWWVLDPLLQMAVYVVLVSIIFERPQVDYPLFVFSAILPWKWFTSSINDSIKSVIDQGQLIRQLQFPKVVLPLAATFAGVVNFMFGMIPLFSLLVLFYRDRLTLFLLLIPVIGLVQLTFTIAFSLVLSAVNVFLRDIGNIARHALRLWFYLSPGLYALTTLEGSKGLKEHPSLLRVLEANPFAILFTAYRNVIYGTVTTNNGATPPQMPDWASLGALFGGSVILILVGMFVFKRLEPSFAKVL